MILPLFLLLAPQDPSPPIEYRGGIRTTDASGEVNWRFNGRIMFDWIDPEGELAEAVSDRQHIRRARILAQGSFGEHLGARLQWDFSDSESDLLEGMVDLRTFPWGTLRLGHFREPFGFDARTSSAHLTFLERSSPTDAFTAGRNRGVQVRERGRDWSLALGCFRSADDPFRTAGEETAVSARVTWLPHRSEDDRDVTHVGLSITQRDLDDDGLRLAARPPARLIDRLVDTDTLAVDRSTVLGLEGAWKRGPLSAQAEAFLADGSDVGGAPWGLSIQVSWFVTGETKSYRDSASSFGAPDLSRSFFDGGKGAWELALRYSRTDLEDGGFDGGTLEDVTLGLNWYWNEHARWMLNYVDARQEPTGLHAGALLLRLHLGF